MKTTIRERYIIRVSNGRRNEVGYITFDWINGRRYPECFGVSDKAQTMTERQMEYFDDILSNNGYEYEVVKVL